MINLRHIGVFIAVLATTQPARTQNALKHFIFFSHEREGIHDTSFYLNPGVAGAQITYHWKKLEPQKDKYDFSQVEEDLNFLTTKGKRLFIQLQDVTFDSTYMAVPKYLLTDTMYHGGVNAQYGINAAGKPVKGGWVARRWDPAVAERYHLLLIKLAERFDGRIEGINLPETALDFPAREGLLPEGFTNSNYVNAIKKNMLVLKTCFKKSVALQYANFMPGDSREDLVAIYNYAKKIKLAMGGPDIKVYRPAQMANSYPLIRSIAGIVPTGVAVQEGNYSVLNPQTNQPVTVAEILDFAQNYLLLSYIFWCREEPYYSQKVLRIIRSQKK